MDFVNLFPKEILTSVGTVVIFILGLIIAGKIKWIPINLSFGKQPESAFPTAVAVTGVAVTKTELFDHCARRQTTLSEQLSTRDRTVDAKLETMNQTLNKIFEKLDKATETSTDILQRLSRIEGAQSAKGEKYNVK